MGAIDRLERRSIAIGKLEGKLRGLVGIVGEEELWLLVFERWAIAERRHATIRGFLSLELRVSLRPPLWQRSF